MTDEIADYSIERDAFIARMEAEGFVVSYPAPHELQIDIDSDADMDRHSHSWEVLKRNMDREGVRIDEQHRMVTASKSGTGRHVRIELPFPLTPIERIAYQAALGSDPVRELLSLFRLRRGDQHPTLLVETQEVAKAL